VPAEAAYDGVNEAIVSVTNTVFVFVSGWLPGGELAVEEDHIDYIVVDLRGREFRGLKCKCVAPRLVFRQSWKDLKLISIPLSNVMSRLRFTESLYNVLPAVADHQPWRITITLQASELSPSQTYNDIIDVVLFYSQFSSRKPLCNENEHSVGHADDRFVDAIDRRFSWHTPAQAQPSASPRNSELLSDRLIKAEHGSLP